MKTILLVKLAFLPAILFGVLTATGYRLLALDVSAVVSACLVGWNLRRGLSRPLETALLITLAGTALVTHLGYDLTTAAVWLVLLGQGLAGIFASLSGRAWTSDYSSAEYAEVRETDAFKAVNTIISNLWNVLFLVLAVLGALDIGGYWSTAVTVLGILLSLFGPKALVRWRVHQMIAARERFRWPDPDFSRPARPGDVDVAIIGAGLGGLTAAALLAEAGKSVVVAEQHVEPGGFCHHWLRKTRHHGEPLLFRFDAGIHDFSGAHAGGSLSGVLERLGIRLDWARMRQTMWLDGEPLVVAEDWRDHAAALGRRFPESAAGLMRVFEEMKTILDSLYASGKARSGVPTMPDTVEAMLAFPRDHPLAARWMNRPFTEFVARHVANPRAVEALLALSGYLTDRPEDLTVLDMAPIFGYYIHGGFYPRGGSGVVSHALVTAIEERGGEVLLKSPVDSILVEDGRAVGIRLASGREIRARAVISNADLKRTFTRLVPDGALPPEIRESFGKVEPATSAFMVHLGLDRQPEITPIASARTEDGIEVGLVSPSRVDPSAAPAGYATLELIALVPHAEAAAWFLEPGIVDDKAHRHGNDYAARKAAFGDRMIRAAETMIPGLSDHIVYRADASPLTFARYDWSSDGAIYGVAAKDRFDGLKSPLPGLYLAGAGNFGPGAEAAVIVGARLAERLAPGVLAIA